MKLLTHLVTHLFVISNKGTTDVTADITIMKSGLQRLNSFNINISII